MHPLGYNTVWKNPKGLLSSASYCGAMVRKFDDWWRTVPADLKTKARTTRDRDTLTKLAAASHPLIIRNVLLNPMVTEPMVVRMAARRPTRPEPLTEIWLSPRWCAQHAVRRADVDPDLGARVAGPDDEHVAGDELRRVAVVGGVQLHDVPRELGGERRRTGLPVVARGQDDVVGPERLRAGGHQEPVDLAEETVDVNAEPDREVESLDVLLQVLDHLVLGGEPVAGRERSLR